MKGQEFKILFEKDKAYLTTDKPLTFLQVELSGIAKSFKGSAFWTIRVLNHIETEKKLYCEILSYNVGDTEFSYTQKSLASKLHEIEKVTFRSIDTSGLLQTLNSTMPLSYAPKKEEPVFRKEAQSAPIQSSIVESNQSVFSEPIKRTITERFFIPFKNIRFKLGGVSFDKKFKECSKLIELNISKRYKRRI
jgi:hypothetical protein